MAEKKIQQKMDRSYLNLDQPWSKAQNHLVKKTVALASSSLLKK